MVGSLLLILLWLPLAAAFVLIALRCGPADRAVAIMAWLVAAAALAGPLSFLVRTPFHLGQLPVSLALIAFGITAHRKFGWPWSAPAWVGGLLGVAAAFLGLFLMIWAVPLFILGIAMCRTRIDVQTRPS